MFGVLPHLDMPPLVYVAILVFLQPYRTQLKFDRVRRKKSINFANVLFLLLNGSNRVFSL